jgi:hypothetical protein
MLYGSVVQHQPAAVCLRAGLAIRTCVAWGATTAAFTVSTECLGRMCARARQDLCCIIIIVLLQQKQTNASIVMALSGTPADSNGLVHIRRNKALRRRMKRK